MMALGGVATGIMNAQEAAKATGMMSSRGAMPIPTATVATIGRKTAVVAVLDVISVRKTINAVTAATIIRVGKPDNQAQSPAKQQ